MSLKKRIGSLSKRIPIITLLSTTFALGVVSVVTDASAQEVSGSQSFTCSNATLQGIYGFQDSGFQGTKAPFTPVTAVRTTIFDGRGNFTGNGFISQGGVVNPYTITATYKVGSDCTVTVTGSYRIPGRSKSQPITQFGVIVDRGKKILAVDTATGTNQKLIYERVR